MSRESGVPRVASGFVEELRRVVHEAGGSLGQASRRAAGLIQAHRQYRWVGIYRVEPRSISAVAWTGPKEPAHPSFPVTQGLCGQAVHERRTVVVGDVRNDPHYLTTFGTTRSEIVVPIRRGDAIVGLIDAESDRVNAFSDRDRVFLEACAGLLAEYWD